MCENKEEEIEESGSINGSKKKCEVKHVTLKGNGKVWRVLMRTNPAKHYESHKLKLQRVERAFSTKGDQNG